MVDDYDPHKIGLLTAGTVPKTEGVSDGEAQARDPRLRIAGYSDTATLADIAKENVLFTHALFFTHGNMDVDPVSHYVNTQMVGDITIGVLDFDQPIFDGFPQTPVGRAWATKLMVCPRPYWSGLYKYLGGIAAVNKEQQSFWLAGAQDLAMPDFLALRKLSVLPVPVPSVYVAVFCVAGMQQNVGMTAQDMARPLRIAYENPSPDVIEVGRKLLSASHPAQLEEA